jgi:hypothetical protein
MSSNDALIALVCITLILVVGVQWWRWARRRARRLARKLHYRRAGESRPQGLQAEGDDPVRGITPEGAAAIRFDAEQAALSAGGSGEAANPYARGTPEFVLWIATYHLTQTELEEQAANAATLSRHA